MKPAYGCLLVLVACTGTTKGTDDKGSSSTGDAGHPDPFQLMVTPVASLNATTPLRQGPYLQAPGLGTVTVSWHTDAASESVVSFGLVGGLTSRVTGTVFQQQPTTEDALAQGTLPTGYQHEVVLTGLTAGTAYHYTVESVSTPLDGTFTAPPDAGEGYTFFLMGDTRTNATEHGSVIAAMARVQDNPGPLGKARFVVNTGDLTAAGGTESLWDTFFTVERPLLANVPLLAVFGNHEVIMGRTIFEGFFRPPPSNTSPSERYYSATIGDVHIATVDVYALELEPHLEWLQRDLTSSNAPFKMVFMHPPLFTMSNHLPEVALRAQLQPVLQAGGAQLLVTGHNHVYERFMQGGIRYVVTGGGGAPLYGINDNANADNGTATRITAASTLHFVQGSVDGRKMKLEVISVPDGTRVDCFVVDADHPSDDVACP